MKYYKDGEYHKVVYISGPRHNFLGVSFYTGASQKNMPILLTALPEGNWSSESVLDTELIQQ